MDDPRFFAALASDKRVDRAVLVDYGLRLVLLDPEITPHGEYVIGKENGPQN
ncbi:MAG: hypothetical protein AAGA69_05615 [Pseudomonadota bacterium]